MLCRWKPEKMCVGTLPEAEGGGPTSARQLRQGTPAWAPLPSMAASMAQCRGAVAFLFSCYQVEGILGQMCYKQIQVF